MKRLVFSFSIAILLVFALGLFAQPSFVFAQTTDASEEAHIQELQAIVVQLLSLIADLQQQLIAAYQGQVLGASACAQAEIVWEEVSGAEEYILYRDGTEVYRGTELRFTDIGLMAGAQYEYTVRARNVTGLSPVSPAQIISIPSQCPPPAPFVWGQTGVCGGTIQAWWSRTQGATYYEVFRGNTRVFAGLNVSFIDRGLGIETEYIYKVRAGNSGGVGEFSQEVNIKSSAICPPLAPEAPDAPRIGSPSLDDDRAEEGILTFAMHGNPSRATAQSGGGSVDILSFRTTAKHSTIIIEHVDVDFSDRPWLFLSVIELRDNGRTVSRIEASQDAFVRVGENNRLRFFGLAIRIGAGGSRNITVGVVPKKGLRVKDPRELIVSIPSNSVRGKDEIGVPHAGPDSISASSFSKTFFVTKELP